MRQELPEDIGSFLRKLAVITGLSRRHVCRHEGGVITAPMLTARLLITVMASLSLNGTNHKTRRILGLYSIKPSKLICLVESPAMTGISFVMYCYEIISGRDSWL